MKKSQKGFTSLVLLIIIGVIMIGAGIYYQSHKSRAFKLPPYKPLKAQSNYIPKATISSEELQTWKSYTFPTYDFSIKYPTDWTMTDHAFDRNKNPVHGSEWLANADQSCVFSFMRSEETPTESNDLYTVIPKNINLTDGTTVLGYFSYNLFGNKQIDNDHPNLIVIDGIPKKGHKTPVGETDAFFRLTAWMGGGKLFDNCMAVFDKILSTVKFQ